MNTLGDRLKNLREEKKLKQTELARIFENNNISITSAAISQYEANKRVPDHNILSMYADYFEVTVDYLLCRSDFKNINAMAENNENNQTELNKKDKKQIEKILENTEKALLEGEGLMFNGEPASQEAVQSIIDAMKIGMELAKKRNKEKYTPKKYKEDI